MTLDDLQASQRQHNVAEALKGTGYLIAGVLLWIVSYWVVVALFWLPCVLWGDVPSWTVTRAVAWGGMLLLAVEGVRHGKRLFDLSAYAESVYAQGITGTQTERALGRVTGSPLGTAYVLSQILFAAPRATVGAIKSFTSLVRFSQEELDTALSLARELAERNAWVPLEPYMKDGPVLVKLFKLGLVWHDVKDGSVQIRFAADRVGAFKDNAADR